AVWFGVFRAGWRGGGRPPDRVFIFDKKLDSANIEMLQKQVAKFTGFSISFINVAEYFEDENLKTCGHLTVEMYFRLAAPYILTDYKKILYFDCDLICRADVRGLYETGLGDNLVGAVSQLNVFQYNHKNIPDEYNKLNLKNPGKYFNSGVLLMNAEQFRKTVKLEDMLGMAASLLDQDILNIVCEDKTYYLPYRWNYVIDYSYTDLPEPLKREYIEYGKNPSIIHFQPWTHIIQTLFSRYFWDYASRTPFYAEIRRRKRANFKKNLKKYFRHAAGYLKFGGIKPLLTILRDAVFARK
ncbi:MAG: glycosyltransferase family 8 protein, partial [Spirochaetaceae bacterium]|nr:glycosyltransferase family 8 protein [Spirochaetaceae bacterium]